MEQPFRTRDAALAAFIYSKGIIPAIDRSDYPFDFVFQGNVDPFVKEWETGVAMVNGVLFYRSYRKCLALLHNGGQ